MISSVLGYLIKMSATQHMLCHARKMVYQRVQLNRELYVHAEGATLTFYSLLSTGLYKGDVMERKGKKKKKR